MYHISGRSGEMHEIHNLLVIHDRESYSSVMVMSVSCIWNFIIQKMKTCWTPAKSMFIVKEFLEYLETDTDIPVSQR